MTVDGRVARREKNQHAVLESVIDLFDSGVIEPSVDDVADLSGVSTRSIYRYFHHREGLIDAAMWHQVARAEERDLLDLDQGIAGGDQRAARVSRFVAHRLRIYTRIAPLVRAANRQIRIVEADDEPVTDRYLFAVTPSMAFATEFAQLSETDRAVAEVTANMAFEFDALEFLNCSTNGDLAVMTTLLERHLHHQFGAAVPVGSS